MMEHQHRFDSAVVFLGHPVFGGGAGQFSAVAGVHLADGLESLQEAVEARMAESPVLLQRVGSNLLYVAWPELWRPNGPLPPLAEEDAQRESLLRVFDASLARPALVSRLGQTPTALRGELIHRPEALLDRSEPLSEAGPIGRYSTPSHLPLLFERQGQLLIGSCRRGLLDSFDLCFESIFQEDLSSPASRPGERGR